MYGRKTKKKSSAGSSSNWGPRIALEEAEQTYKSGIYSQGSVFKNPYAQIGTNGPNPNSGFSCQSNGRIQRKGSGGPSAPLSVQIPSVSKYDLPESLPSTETWQSSGAENLEDDDDDPDELPEDFLQDLDILEVSIPTLVQGNNIERSASYRSLGGVSENNAPGTSMTSAQGITMVYVPMERAGRGSKVLGHRESPVLPCSPQPPPDPRRDPDTDSLLESFDSVIFNPRGSLVVGHGSPVMGHQGHHNHGPPAIGQKGNHGHDHDPPAKGHHSHAHGAPNIDHQVHNDLGSPAIGHQGNGSPVKGHQGHGPLPPALPPKNKGGMGLGGSKKSLRFSDLLDIKPQSPAEDKVLNEDPVTVLSCGHTRDNYSTLSSVASSRASYSPHSAPESVCEKSALQQLRDLSILIGGSFHEPNVSPPDDPKLRKTSTATSADSGKGSAGTESSSVLNETNNGAACSCEEALGNHACIFRPECEECLKFFRNPFESGPVLQGPESGSGSKRKPSFSASRQLKRRTKFAKNPKTTKVKRESLDSNSSYCDCAQCECLCLKGQGRSKTQLILGKSQQLISGRKKVLGLGRRSPSGSLNSLDPLLFTIDEEDERKYEYGPKGPRKQFAENEKRTNHNHPQCWLATDATMGWSDLESLYSMNMKRQNPLEVNGECWTCWKELSQFKQTANTTMDRTKRMFIWLNKRPKEFNAPWWEAKKLASIKWLLSKAFPSLRKDSTHLIPMRESKKDKTKLRLKEDVIGGLVSGRLYTMALHNLYAFTGTDSDLQQQLARHLRAGGRLALWEIIRILSRKAIYVAQPSDMKLTEGTLRQRKPLRVAAHIALIEAIMGLYAKELLSRDRVLAILNTFGHTLKPDVLSPEQLVISWINSAITTLKTFILSSNKLRKTISTGLHRWLNVGLVEEIRDLSDGVGLGALFALYFSSEVGLEDISVPEPGETLGMYESGRNQGLVQALCLQLFPQALHHLTLNDFLYVHGHMKQNVLALLVDLFTYIEIQPAVRVNPLAHVPLRVQL